MLEALTSGPKPQAVSTDFNGFIRISQIDRKPAHCLRLDLLTSFPMPTYTYETIPQFEGDLPKRFELKQSMKDAALTQHPDSGQPVRRVITGGTGFMGVSGGGASSSSSGGKSGGSCGTGCGCH